jgi:DNA polymerase-3 subunit epsilon
LELPNQKKINQLDFLNNEIKNNDNEKPNFLNKSILSSKNNNQNQSIENILILDTETTGLDENKDEII